MAPAGLWSAAMLIDHGARLDVRDDLLKSTPLGMGLPVGTVGDGGGAYRAWCSRRRTGCRALGHTHCLGQKNESQRDSFCYWTALQVRGANEQS